MYNFDDKANRIWTCVAAFDKGLQGRWRQLQFGWANAEVVTKVKFILETNC